MTDINLIALDMDGTLLNDTKNITNLTRSYIKEAHDRGIHIILCTGRPFSHSKNYVQELNLDSKLITCNGGQLYSSEHTVITEYLLDTETLAYLFHQAQGLGMDTWVISTEEPYFNHLPENYQELHWLKFGCHVKDDETALDRMVKKLSFRNDVEISNASDVNIEVNPVGVNKAVALELVCDQLGVNTENVMAVGDSLNDIKMIQTAGVGVAMANAQTAVKQAADTITDTNNNDGVGKAIEQHVLSAKV